MESLNDRFLDSSIRNPCRHLKISLFRVNGLGETILRVYLTAFFSFWKENDTYEGATTATITKGPKRPLKDTAKAVKSAAL